MSRFSLVREGPKVTVKVGADLTAAVAPELRELLCAIQEDGVQELTLDMSETAALDAMGLSLLLAARNSFHSERAFKLVFVSEALHTVLETLQLHHRFNA